MGRIQKYIAAPRPRLITNCSGKQRSARTLGVCHEICDRATWVGDEFTLGNADIPAHLLTNIAAAFWDPLGMTSPIYPSWRTEQSNENSIPVFCDDRILLSWCSCVKWCYCRLHLTFYVDLIELCG